MVLEMRNICEKCNKKFYNSFVVYICIYECIFCDKCSENEMYICFNCGGELVKRLRGKEYLLSCLLSLL